MGRLYDDQSIVGDLRIEGCFLPGSTFTIAPLPLTFTNIYLFLNPQQGGFVEDCDAVPDAGRSMWTARVLSIIVKNMQSYIVAVVWGAAEVWLLCKSKVWRRSKQPTVLLGVLPHHGPSSGLAETKPRREK